jgi:hypothetical protein
MHVHVTANGATADAAPSRSCTLAGCTDNAQQETERVDEDVPLRSATFLPAS